MSMSPESGCSTTISPAITRLAKLERIVECVLRDRGLLKPSEMLPLTIREEVAALEEDVRSLERILMAERDARFDLMNTQALQQVHAQRDTTEVTCLRAENKLLKCMLKEAYRGQ